MSKSERAIEAMRAALADPPQWIEVKSARVRPFLDGWSGIERATAIGTVDENRLRIVTRTFHQRAKPNEVETRAETPDAIEGAIQSTMTMLGDVIIREEYGDLLAVGELLEKRRSRRFLEEVARWVQPLLDGKGAPDELKARYRELVEDSLPAELGQIDERARKLNTEQVADAIDRARSRSVDAIAGWLAVLSGALDGAPQGGEDETSAHGRMCRRFRGLRDRQEDKRLERLKK